MYSFLKNLLFIFPPEFAHYLVMKMLRVALYIPGLNSVLSYQKVDRYNLAGISFKNRLGMAAGFDKNAEYVDILDKLGFGYIEIGTVTPESQEGNPKPRLFRLKEEQALMNRMGFNNYGVKKVVENLKKLRGKGYTIGGNIGKNKWTPNEEAHADYLKCFEAMYDYVDYFVVNVSSPNTPNLRALQDKDTLINIFEVLQNYRNNQSKSKPIFLKIAPDLTEGQLDDIISVYHSKNIDALIVSNTTIDYEVLNENKAFAYKEKMGGISGKPIANKTNSVIRYIKTKDKSIKLIGVGGIDSAASAQDKLDLGCDLLQLYTGFVYKGNGLVKEILEGIILK
jgi:dihydroorotate dehydrogenase